MAAPRLFGNYKYATHAIQKAFSTAIDASITSSLPHSSSSPPLICEDVDLDFLSAKDSVADDSIDWDFGRQEKEDFLFRPKGRHALPLVHHHGFVCEIPPKHRFVMGKFDGLYNYLMMDRVLAPEQVKSVVCTFLEVILSFV